MRLERTALALISATLVISASPAQAGPVATTGESLIRAIADRDSAGCEYLAPEAADVLAQITGHRNCSRAITARNRLLQWLFNGATPSQLVSGLDAGFVRRTARNMTFRFHLGGDRGAVILVLDHHPQGWLVEEIRTRRFFSCPGDPDCP